MRILVGAVFVGGLALFVGAGFMLIDRSVSEDARQSLHAGIEERLDRIEDNEGRSRMARHAARAVEAGRALGRDVFFEPDILLSAVMPDEVQGWTRRDWQAGDDKRITGHERVASALTRNATQSVLGRFQDATQGGKQAQSRAFETPEGLVAIRLGLDLKQARRTEKADGAVMADILKPAARDRDGRPVATLAGFPLRETPRKSETPNGQIHEAHYLHLRLNVGKLMAVEVISNAPRDQVMALVQALEMKTVRAALPGQQTAKAAKF